MTDNKQNEDFMDIVQFVENALREPIYDCIQTYGEKAVLHSLKWWIKVIEKFGRIKDGQMD